MSYAIELVQVTKSFGNYVAVDNVSLQIKDGEFFSLLGPSGCGKTTSLRMIAGFEMPTSGEIHLHGQSVGDLPPFKRPINTVFQNYALFPHLSVAQNVGFGLEMRHIPKPEITARVGEALAMVRMAEFANRRPNQLSGGQQQRVALARALVNRPEVLLLDEPLGALDLKLRKQMQLELKAMQAEIGITFIYVTHDQEEALTMSDRIAVMHRGKVLQCASPREIYERPLSRYVADFIGETNFLEGVLTANGDLAEVTVGDAVRVIAAPTTDTTAGQKVTVAIRPEKINVVWLRDSEGNPLDPEAKAAQIMAEEGCVSARAAIKESIYIGTDTRYVVRLTGSAEGTEMVARMQNFGTRYDQYIPKGEAVLVYWTPENARILLD
ncbi:MAG TPA: ABC transporter ATP-binding protein [Aggregatilineales bacterium]|nr:ABC transporter ATP-binding protein [Anaerolineales bacterium]HRE46767.1 ABC transporter ATP-binding protein [Aggregatilineales bacterium]